MITARIEDYLEEIFLLESEDRGVSDPQRGRDGMASHALTKCL